MADAETKRCRCCQQELPRSEFSARPTNRDGLYSYCRACSVQRAREYCERRPDWKEHKRRYDRERVARLRDKLSAQARERYKKTREQRIESARRWAKQNPERRRAIARNYKARRKTQEAAGVSTAELAEWTAAQKKVCYWCGARCAKDYHVDHYEPLAKGGKHELGNLVIACPACNLTKNAKDPFDFAKEVGRLL